MLTNWSIEVLCILFISEANMKVCTTEGTWLSEQMKQSRRVGGQAGLVRRAPSEGKLWEAETDD